MDNEPTLLQVQHILYPLQHQVCIGTIKIKGHVHLTEAPSMASGASLESHMTEISKTMLELAQANMRRLPALNNKIIRPW